MRVTRAFFICPKKRKGQLMKYTAVLKNSEKVRRLTIEAESVKEAHSIIRELTSGKGMKIVIYPIICDEYGKPYTDGIIEGAWRVCKDVLTYLTSREGLDHQWELLNDIIQRRTDGLAADCHQEAMLALLEEIGNNTPIEEKYNKAYNAVNRWLYHNHLRNWIHRKQETFPIDAMSDYAVIVEVSQGMFSIIKTDSNYIPMPREVTVVRDMQRVAMILQTLNDLTEKQMQIVYNIVSRDMSIQGAARETNTTMSCAYTRVKHARKTALANMRLYAQHKASKRELRQLFNALSPLAREVALDVLQRRSY